MTIVLACTLLLWGGRAFALDPSLDVSQYGHTSWKIRDGFFKSRITVVAQTQDGYLWLGTELGLLRFDGVRSVPLQLPPGQSLPHSWIRTLYVSRDGTLWIGTLGGLASWKDRALRLYPDIRFSVDSLLEDRDGTVWAGGTDPTLVGRLCAIIKDRVRCSGEDTGFGRSVTSLYEDNAGALWATSTTGLWRWTPGPPQRFSLPEPVAGALQSLARNDDGTPLVAIQTGIARLVDGKFERFSLPAAAPPINSPKLFRDRDGSLWVGTDSGLRHMHRGRMDAFTRLDGLSGDFVNRLFEDREGDIWVVTGDGLDRFRDLAGTTLAVRKGLSFGSTSAVVASVDGSVWINSSGALNRWNGGRITVTRTPETRDVQSIFQDRRGRIWVATRGGLGYVERDRFTSIHGVPGGNMLAFAQDARGILWLANQDAGLVGVSPDGGVQTIPWSGLGHKDPAGRVVADDARGGLWLGFYQGGLVYYEGGRVVETYSMPDGGASRINDLRLDRDGALWVASERGLSRLKSGRMAALTSESGLPCGRVAWMADDAIDSVWLRTECGLLRVARSELEAWAAAVDKAQAAVAIHPTLFDSSDGIRSGSDVSSFSPLVTRSADGRLWFADEDGVSIVDPRHLPFNTLPPPVHIEQITADREVYDLAPSAEGSVRLPPLSRDLQIDYTALSLVAPEKIRFRYKLEGRDRDWQDAGNRRQAFYSDLPPGNFRFRVIAANNSGVWNETGATLDFAIAPAYYQTAWFRALVVVAFISLIVAAYRLRLRQIATQYNARLDARVAERTRIARDLHDTLLQSFQGVLLKFHAVSYMLGENPAAREKLDGVIEQARQAITEGRDAVQGLRASTLAGNDLARTLITFCDELQRPEDEDNRARLQVEVEGTSRDLAALVHDDVYRIACEALRNAHKHAGATRIEVEIQYGERQFRLRIRDDGSGMDPEVLRQGARAGHFGLPGMYERASALGGTLTVWSERNAGTEIELTIPAGIAYAKASGAPSFA
jgi:signal transduction histidine kinase/ligand-binding sensor domain-containing protein